MRDTGLRDRGVLSLIKDGWSYREIAALLDIGVATINRIVQSVPESVPLCVPATVPAEQPESSSEGVPHATRNEVADVARRVAGVGSVGMRCWIVLLLGRDLSDPLFLQVKEAGPSVLSAFAGASEYANEGQRVVYGQRLMQASSDIFLGWQRTGMGTAGQARDFYVRQLRDWKLSIDVESMSPRSLRVYWELCAWTLARAHARSGDRIAIGAYLGGGDVFDRAIGEFAAAYADQNERDYQALRAAVATGRLTAETGV